MSSADLLSLKAENDWLTKTCRDYVDALTRAGNALGLEGWVAISECSGVLLEVSPVGGCPRAASGPTAGAAPGATGAIGHRGHPGHFAPKVGQILSWCTAGPNPVSLALEQAGVALIPPGDGAVFAPGAFGRAVSGLGVPLGDSAVPLGCLAVLVPDREQEACLAVFGQALFSAKAINLALNLREERQANLEVAAGMAHEVKNPLTAVKGFLELTLAHRTEVPEYAGLALRELDRAISLLEDYCLFSRAPRIMPTQCVAVDGLIAEAALVARGLVASGPSISIVSHGADPGLFIRADPPRVKQVLLNLFMNAMQAMEEEGSLRIHSEKVVVGGRRELVLSVADTGKGIAPEHQSRIFDPFFTTKAKGLGLGLSITYRIVQRHRGRIRVQSEPGRGTTFFVHLPCERH